MTNWKKIQKRNEDLIKTLNKELGWFNKEELDNTPRRITNYYKELIENNKFNFTKFNIPTNYSKSMILLKDIDFYSLCAHHMLPFYGKIHLSYLAREGGQICGVSKLARAARKYASKPQTQEQMSNEIVDYLMKELDAWFVMIVVEAQHLCMLMRGIKQHESKMVTSAIRWDKKKFKSSEDLNSLKQEVMSLIKMR